MGFKKVINPPREYRRLVMTDSISFLQNDFRRWKSRGEALMRTDITAPDQVAITSAEDVDAMSQDVPRWYVIWTKSNCEQMVYDQLSAQGFELFLPTVDKWSRRLRKRQLHRVPMFPGYIFIHQTMDKSSYIRVCKARGLVRILGERWDRLAAVDDQEIEVIRRVHDADMPRMPHPYLHEGQTVRIITGPLANVEGILVKSEPKKGLLVLSIELLRQSLAVQIDCTQVVAV
jgi:transcriptional antiterminator NusG